MQCGWLPGSSRSRARRDEGSYQYGPDEAQRRSSSTHQTWYEGSVSSERKAFPLYSSTESGRTPRQFSHQHCDWWGYSEWGGEYLQSPGIGNQIKGRVWSRMAGFIPQTIEAHNFVNDSQSQINWHWWSKDNWYRGILCPSPQSPCQSAGRYSINWVNAGNRTRTAGHFHVRWS